MHHCSRRILLLNTDLEIGGTPTVVRELATHLTARAGAHVEVVGLGAPGPLREELLARRIKCTALGARGGRDLPIALRRLLRLVRQERIDTVCSFLIHANTVAALLRPMFPRARYIQSIQTTQPNPRWHWSLQRLIAGAADRVLVPSPSVARVAQFRCGIPANKIVTIPNAVHLASFELANAPQRTTDNGPRTTGRICFIGRLDPIKNIPVLLRAMAILPEAVTLDVYGAGPELSRLQAMVSQMNLARRVTFHGAVPSPTAALASADVLVLPSRAEGFGLVLIEAMAAGVPVVASDAPGIRDVVTHEATGLLTPVGDSAGLARAIMRVLEDSALRRRLVSAGRAEVEWRFTWDAVWPAYEKLFGLRASVKPL